MSWVPDKLLLYVQFFLQTGKIMNLRNPKTFQDFIQFYKLYYRNSSMRLCTDKVEVRKYVKQKGLESILIPVIGIYDKAEDINYENLPDKFVMKASDGGGNNQVLICQDKKEFTKDSLLNIAQIWMSAPRSRKHIAREWAYDNNIPRKIIIEELLENPDGRPDMDDYKFFCYKGKFKVLEWHKDRSQNHTAAHYDENLQYMPEVKIYNGIWEKTPFPPNFTEMVKVAETLSQEFPFVRVDLYNLKGKIYFGEMTFYPASGYYVYHPENVNVVLGSFFKDTELEKIIISKNK